MWLPGDFLVLMHPRSHRPGRNCLPPPRNDERKKGEERKRWPSQIDSLSREHQGADAGYVKNGNSVPWRGEKTTGTTRARPRATRSRDKESLESLWRV
ncbi:hypothetical protein BJX64DRAFT_77163 [Aspergillus heterothallicus]